MLRGLFEGAQYNSEAGAKCAVYSRERTKQGCGVIKEIRYLIQRFNQPGYKTYCKLEQLLIKASNQQEFEEIFQFLLISIRMTSIKIS